MRQIRFISLAVPWEQPLENAQTQMKGWFFTISFIMFVAMDAQFWIYILIVVIYGLSRFFKKPEEKPQTQQPKPRNPRIPQSQADGPRPKPLTFEELLREITEAKQPQRPVQSPVLSPPPVQEYKRPQDRSVVDYDDEVGEEEQDIEAMELERRRERSNAYYEEAKKQAFSRPSLEETLKVRDTDVRFGKFKEFEIATERNLLEEYTRDLKDAEGLKKAFVLTEILNRKF